MTVFRTIYCDDLHRLDNGLPIGHACRVLDPEYLVAERDQEYSQAASLLESMPLTLHWGIPGEGDGASKR